MIETQGTGGAERTRARAGELFADVMAHGRDLACMLISIDRLARYDDPALRELLRTAVEGLVLSEPEGAAWRVLRAGDELMVLCPGLALTDTGPAARGLVEGVRHLQVRRNGRAIRPRVSIGVAHNRKRPDLSFEIFQGVARESLGVAQAAGGDRWVHTELYDLLARRSLSAHVADEAAQAFDFEELSAGLEPLPAVASVVSAAPPATPGVLEHLDLFVEADALTKGQLVEVLERRIGKLSRALEQADGEIQRLQREFGARAGIASIYRTVQGLAPDEPLLEIKRRLMRELFSANRALRKAAS